ncbi:hypothetical protein Tco_1427407 [Tanacetum coccineum]
MSSSTVTYTSPVAPLSPDYVPGPEHPPSPDYVPGPEHLPSLVEVPYVPEPEYPEYLVPSDIEAPLEDQPLPVDASPTALSPGYVADSDPEEDPEEDHAAYPADGGDGDDEPSDNDDDDTDDEDEAGDTKAFETDESAPTPRSPQTKVPFAQTRLRRARKTIRLESLMSASMEARITKHVAAPTPSLPVASPPSPLTTSPTDAGAPLGYRAAGIRMRAASPPLLLPSTSYRTDIPKAEMPPQKRACLTTPALGLEIGESLTAGAARHPGTTLEADLRRDRVIETGYGITILRIRLLRPCWRRMRSPSYDLDREAMYARIAWTSSEDRSAVIEAHVRTLEAQFATLIAQTSSL